MRWTHRRVAVAALGVVLGLGACDGTTEPSAPTTTTTTAPRGAAPAAAGFVAFGDFGGGPAQEDVADAMERWVGEHGWTPW